MANALAFSKIWQRAEFEVRAPLPRALGHTLKRAAVGVHYALDQNIAGLLIN